MLSDSAIPVTLAIDVEPDVRMVARHSSGGWKGFERLADALRSLRRSLPGKGGAPATFTWLLRMDPQIRLAYGESAYAVRRYRDILDEFAAAGDDLGLHTHLYDWDPREQRWVTDFARPEWASTCVAESIGAYRDSFGTAPRAHSFGDRYFSESILDQLEEGGIRCEMSTESGLGAVDQVYPNELHRGGCSDTRHAPRSIWRPAYGETLRHDPAGGRPLLMMPISTYRFPHRFEVGRWITMRRRQLRGLPGNMDERTQRYMRLCLEHRPYVFRYGLRQLEQEFAPGHLQFVFNSSQTLDDGSLQRYVANIRYLCSSPGARRYEFVSAMQSIV